MIRKKSKEEIIVLREGGKILVAIMDELCDMVEPGLMTHELENRACELMDKYGGRPAQKNFDMGGGKVFPTAIITCINEEVVHASAIPSRKLKNGDILSLDFVMEYPIHDGKNIIPADWPVNEYSEGGGYYTDMSRTIGVGKISPEAKKLMAVTKRALDLAIGEIRPGKRLSDMGNAIQSYVESEGYSLIRDLVGHGVGYSLHEDPVIPNYRVERDGPYDFRFEPGMVLAVEPMVAAGHFRVKENHENFAYYTADRKLSAHFEHSVAVTEDGNQILTRK